MPKALIIRLVISVALASAPACTPAIAPSRDSPKFPVDVSALGEGDRNIYEYCQISDVLGRTLEDEFSRVDPDDVLDLPSERRTLAIAITAAQFAPYTVKKVLVSYVGYTAVLTMEGELRSPEGSALGSFTLQKEMPSGYRECAKMNEVIKGVSREIAEWSKKPSPMTLLGDR